MVDDEPFMLEGMRLMIDWAGHGFELVGEASSAQEALHLVDTLRPHLLITDVIMPGMNGRDLDRQIMLYLEERLEEAEELEIREWIKTDPAAAKRVAELSILQVGIRAHFERQDQAAGAPAAQIRSCSVPVRNRGSAAPRRNSP